jgi:hypothetical protein
LKDPDIDERIILKWIFERLDGEHRLDDLAQDRDSVAGSCKCGDKPSGSINAGNLLSSLGCFSFSGTILLHGVSLVMCTAQLTDNGQ